MMDTSSFDPCALTHFPNIFKTRNFFSSNFFLLYLYMHTLASIICYIHIYDFPVFFSIDVDLLMLLVFIFFSLLGNASAHSTTKRRNTHEKKNLFSGCRIAIAVTSSIHHTINSSASSAIAHNNNIFTCM